MRTLYKTRRNREGDAVLATMDFAKGPTVILTFEDGKKAKFGTAFIADAVEHYVEFCIEKALNYEEKKNALKKRK
jgi:hypothetical protein